MNFQFVENNSIDDAFQRKRIRKHVMLGKNTGKRAVPSSKHRLRQPPRPILQKAAKDPPEFSDCKHAVDYISLSKPVGDELAYFTFPVPLDAYMTFLIRRFMWAQVQSIYPVEFCIPMQTHKSMWFRFLLSSETFFHNTLAVAQHCADTLEGQGIDSYQYYVYLGRTYRSMTREFKATEQPSDEFVAAVASLLYHENTSSSDQVGAPIVHLDALERIVKMRGGLQGFPIESTLLLQKICRGDIDYAIHHGTTPRFFRDKFPYKMLPISRKDGKAMENLLYRSHDFEFQPQLQFLHDDFKRLCDFLNTLSMPPELDASDFEDALISLAYRFLSLRPLGWKASEDNVENAYQLGAIAILWSVLFESGRLHRRSYDLLAERLRDAAHRLSSDGTNENEILLWLLFVGGITVLGSDHKIWLHDCIKCCLAFLSLRDWQTTFDTLKVFPWIHLVHDKAAEKLFFAVLGCHNRDMHRS